MLLLNKHTKIILSIIRILSFILVLIIVLSVFIPYLLTILENTIQTKPSEHQQQEKSIEVKLPVPNLLDGFAVFLRGGR
jgi:hypothetical protein